MENIGIIAIYGSVMLFTALCVISVLTEEFEFDNAALRNFFRFIRINLREIPIILLFIADILLIVSYLLIGWGGIILAAVLLFDIIMLDGFRIFGRLSGKRKRHKKKRLKWVRTKKAVGETGLAGDTKLAPEMPIMPELPAVIEE